MMVAAVIVALLAAFVVLYLLRAALWWLVETAVEAIERLFRRGGDEPKIPRG